jgi:hypothetical protein
VPIALSASNSDELCLFVGLDVGVDVGAVLVVDWVMH